MSLQEEYAKQAAMHVDEWQTKDYRELISLSVVKARSPKGKKRSK